MSGSDPYAITLAGSAARTATGTGDVLELEDAEALVATLEVTAASGTSPSLTAKVQDAPTPNGPWTDLLTFGAKTGVATEGQRHGTPAIHRYIRPSWTITGTSPSFTFSIVAGVRR